MKSPYRGLINYGIYLLILIALVSSGFWRTAAGAVLFFSGFTVLVFGGLAFLFMSVEMKKRFDATLPLKILLMLAFAAVGLSMMYFGTGLVRHDVAQIWQRMWHH